VKRSEALAILSRDHHQALVVAQQLSRADAADAAAARTRFLEFWQQDGRHHFQLEEELLLPAYAAHGDPRHPLVLQVLGDHVSIRSQAARIGSDPEPPLAALNALGTELAAHVRLEERQLFPLIEAAMPAAELLVLAQMLDAG
jgi:iron-sulfur cluster repair protein YtfE (RIC family)